MRRIWKLWGGLLVSLVLALGAAVPAQAVGEQVTMTGQRAGRYYLKHACAGNKALGVLGNRIYGPDNRIPVAEVRRRLSQLRSLSSRVSNVEYRFVRAMRNPPKQWPDSVAGLVKRLASKDLTISNLWRGAVGAQTARGWIRMTNRANRIRTLPLTSRIRANLNLPAPGKGC